VILLTWLISSWLTVLTRTWYHWVDPSGCCRTRAHYPTTNDPIVLAHGRALLESKPQGRSVYIDADMREPEKILSHPVTRDTLDFTKPVALMLVSVPHFFTADDQVRRIVEPLVGALPPGSYVTASHATAEFAPATREAGRPYTRGGVDVIGRDSDVFADLVFRGLTLVPPGVVVVSEWRPVPGALLPPRADVSNNGAVARKPLSRLRHSSLRHSGETPPGGHIAAFGTGFLLVAKILAERPAYSTLFCHQEKKAPLAGGVESRIAYGLPCRVLQHGYFQRLARRVA